jgi:hypothetical protein
LVSVPYGSKDEEGEAHRRILELAAAAKQQAAIGGLRFGRRASARDAVASTGEAASGNTRCRRSGQVQAGSRWTQFRLLFRRAWKEVSRSKAAFLIKASQQLMIALIYGGIYSLGRTQSSIQDRFGLLSLVAGVLMVMAITTFAPTVSLGTFWAPTATTALAAVIVTFAFGIILASGLVAPSQIASTSTTSRVG